MASTTYHIRTNNDQSCRSICDARYFHRIFSAIVRCAAADGDVVCIACKHDRIMVSDEFRATFDLILIGMDMHACAYTVWHVACTHLPSTPQFELSAAFRRRPATSTHKHNSHTSGLDVARVVETWWWPSLCQTRCSD